MKKYFFAIIILLLVTQLCNAHTINYILEKKTDGQIFLDYLSIGFEHILPYGYDHCLFILCLCLLNSSLKNIFLQTTFFTIAHSITLALVMYEYIVPIPQYIEPIIALSIVFLAIENLVTKKVHSWRILLIFAFGLVHGMGFAKALGELGMPSYSFAKALISFNIGVELGQIAIVLVFACLSKLYFEQQIWYRSKVLIPSNVLIAIIALFWTIERIFY